MIYKQPCRDLDLCSYSFAPYSEKGSTQIYRALYRETIGGQKVTETSVIAFNLPWKRKVITLEFRNIEINICPR